MQNKNLGSGNRPKRSQLSMGRPMRMLVFLFTTIFFVLIGSIAARTYSQRATVAQLESLGAVVEFEDRPGSLLVKFFIGDDAYQNVIGVGMTGEEEFNDEQLSLLLNFPELRQVVLNGSHITDTAMNYVSQIPKLELLALKSTGVTSKGVSQLSAASQLTQLCILSDSNAISEILRGAATLSQVRDLGLQECTLSADDFKYLGGMESLEKIAFMDSQLDRFPDLSHVNRLNFLFFHNVSVSENSSIQLDGLSDLKSLHCSYSNILGNGIQLLTQLKSLESLHLQDIPISDNDLIHLSGLQHLQELSLSDTQITDEGLKQIAKMKSLNSVFLWDSKVTAEGLAIVRALGPEYGASKQALLSEMERLFPEQAELNQVANIH